MICIAIVGTPPIVVMRSLSMIFSALPASKWCIMTILPPDRGTS
jgi:hypothetical protein